MKDMEYESSLVKDDDGNNIGKVSINISKRRKKIFSDIKLLDKNIKELVL